LSVAWCHRWWGRWQSIDCCRARCQPGVATYWTLGFIHTFRNMHNCLPILQTAAKSSHSAAVNGHRTSCHFHSTTLNRSSSSFSSSSTQCCRHESQFSPDPCDSLNIVHGLRCTRWMLDESGVHLCSTNVCTFCMRLKGLFYYRLLMIPAFD
jgi:hypothetical protein